MYWCNLRHLVLRLGITMIMTFNIKFKACHLTGILMLLMDFRYNLHICMTYLLICLQFVHEKSMDSMPRTKKCWVSGSLVCSMREVSRKFMESRYSSRVLHAFEIHVNAQIHVLNSFSPQRDWNCFSYVCFLFTVVLTSTHLYLKVSKIMV